GVPILKTREILGVQEITRIPKAPAWIRGMINLRGKVISVLDLRRKFDLAAVEVTKPIIIIAELRLRDKPVSMGMLVDQVDEVLSIGEEHIEAIQDYGVEIHSEFILGLAKMPGRIVILLDLDKVIGFEESRALETETGAAPDELTRRIP
ncbi:MAG: chemotaxis protein CheW, partial [Spirochaetia bacterium]|nr:chemotaxis protein CheW [Spirochaetia bacterium]